MMVSLEPRSPMPKSTGSLSVPKSMQATYEAITTLTDAFCREYLNEDYRVLAQRMTAALCRKRPSPLASGQPRTWARSEEHTSELQSRQYLVCRLLLEKKK